MKTTKRNKVIRITSFLKKHLNMSSKLKRNDFKCQMEGLDEKETFISILK